MDVTRPPSSSLEWRIVQAYVSLLVAPQGPDGERTASLARHGLYEVRLTEPSPKPKHDAIPFWLELFDHTKKVTLDSFGTYNVEEAAAAAESFISWAELLQQDSKRP